MEQYKVYKAYFHRPDDEEGKHARHEGLFVGNRSESDCHEGEMFHVIEDETLETATTMTLTFDYRECCILETHRYFAEAVPVDTVSAGNMDGVRRVCKNMGSVVTPKFAVTPDCRTWMDNVVYLLDRDGLVRFDGCEIPTCEMPLVPSREVNTDLVLKCSPMG